MTRLDLSAKREEGAIEIAQWHYPAGTDFTI
jgi:hypothetical protein